MSMNQYIPADLIKPVTALAERDRTALAKIKELLDDDKLRDFPKLLRINDLVIKALK